GRREGRIDVEVRDLGGVQGRVDLVARTQDVGPVDQVVADEDPDVLRDVVAELEADLGDDRELVTREMAAVAGQGQEAAVEGGLAAGRREELLHAGDIDLLVRLAKPNLHDAAQEEPAQAPFAIEAELAAVEAIARGERVVDDEAIAGIEIVRAGD